MPIASGAGHWPKEHLVAAAIDRAAKPSGPSYVQSYMPQYTAPNKILPQKASYTVQGPSQPHSPSPSLYPKYPNQPNSPSNGQPYPQYDTPPPRYSSANPRDGGPDGPGSPRWGKNPNQQPKPPRFGRASEKYGQGGHHRFGNRGPSTRTDFGHNRYGVQYNSTRQVIHPKGTRPVGPKGLESYEVYGPRMNMTTGCCGPQMRPLWAMLGGLLALGAFGGMIAGIVLGVKTTTTVKKLPYINPIGSVRYYLRNGEFEPCFDRYATTTTPKTTTTKTTPKPTPVKTTIGPLTTTCIPVTVNTVTTPAVTTHAVTTTKFLGATKTTKAPTTLKPTTVFICTTPAPTTTAPSTVTTTPAPTTTVVTTTPPLTTQTTLPFCDTLTTSITLITLNPLPSPVIYSRARPNSHASAGLFLLLLAFVTKLFVD